MQGLVKFTMELQKMSMKMNETQTAPTKEKKKSTKKKVTKKKVTKKKSQKKSEKKKEVKDENMFGFKTITSEDL